MWRISRQSWWFVRANYTVILSAIHINVLSEVLFVWLILLTDCLKLCVWEKHLWHVCCFEVQPRLMCEFCRFESGLIRAFIHAKRCTVNISPPSLGLCIALIIQFLPSPHVGLKFKTLKWGIIEGMSLMVHSMSVQWQLLLLKALQEQIEGFPWCWTRAAAFMFVAQWERVVC